MALSGGENLLIRKLERAGDFLKTGGPRRVAGIARHRFLDFVESFYPVLPSATYMSVRMLHELGYWPHIRKPRSWNEKIVHRMLYAPHPLASQVADKWRVRQYVADRGLSEILNKVYFVTNEPETIPFDDLPDRFAIKANHGCGWNILVTDKRVLQRQEVVRQCREWLRLRYSRAFRYCETHYDSIVPMILVERFLHDDRYGVPLDYKIDCFHGKARYVGAKRCRSGSITYNRYDTDWNPLDFATTQGMRRGEPVPRPAKLEVMLDVAERLSRGIDYCRVDLYLLNDEELLFGEITMTPAGGLNRVLRQRDFQMGELW
jgi:hypothetical protein